MPQERKYSDFIGGGGRDGNVPLYRRKNANTPDDALSAWVAVPPPPDEVYEQGNCRGMQKTNPELASWFFLDRPAPKKDAAARAVCEGCPVKAPCLAYAMRLPWGIDFGVWGGTNRNQRMKMRPGQRGVKTRERKSDG